MDPRSSRATTYNNLRDLVQAGLVREVAVEGRAARFDAKGMRHHHFICDRCGNVEDIEWYNVPRPASKFNRETRSSRMRSYFPRALHEVRSKARFPLRVVVVRIVWTFDECGKQHIPGMWRQKIWSPSRGGRDALPTAGGTPALRFGTNSRKIDI